MCGFIEVTDIENDKGFLNTNYIIAVRPKKDYTEILIKNHKFPNYIIPLKVKESYEQVKNLILNANIQDCYVREG